MGHLHNTQGRGRVLRTDICTVGLPRPLEANTKIGEILPFSVPVLTKEQDNIDSSWQGNSSFRPVVLGLGGAGSRQAAGEPIPSA